MTRVTARASRTATTPQRRDSTKRPRRKPPSRAKPFAAARSKDGNSLALAEGRQAAARANLVVGEGLEGVTNQVRVPWAAAEGLEGVTDQVRERLAEAAIDSLRKVLGIVAAPFKASTVAGAVPKTSATAALRAGGVFPVVVQREVVAVVQPEGAVEVEAPGVAEGAEVVGGEGRNLFQVSSFKSRVNSEPGTQSAKLLNV